MTNKQILEKAIKKVIESNGSSIKSYPKNYPKGFFTNRDYYSLIFDHYFAQKFWGSKWKDGDSSYVTISEMLSADLDKMKKWQWHLRTMVLKKDPLKYIKKFL